jgi:hypothetical protein
MPGPFYDAHSPRDSLIDGTHLAEGPGDTIAELVSAENLFSGDAMKGCSHLGLMLKKLDFSR